MTEPASHLDAKHLLSRAAVAPDIHRRWPDYAALIIVAEGVTGGPSDDASDDALRDAERSARALLDAHLLDDLSQTVEWRDAFRGFGVKPRQARSSMESLLRRVAEGLPRIDRLTDTYNAVSVLRLLPIGGEDLAHYVGPPRLVIATGDETFETAANGEPIVDLADPGEVIWRDDLEVTCRRWNWRQCRRTQLTGATTTALFILDALGGTGIDGLARAGDELTDRLRQGNPHATFDARVLRS